jgi:hypothetical protein
MKKLIAFLSTMFGLGVLATVMNGQIIVGNYTATSFQSGATLPSSCSGSAIFTLTTTWTPYYCNGGTYTAFIGGISSGLSGGVLGSIPYQSAVSVTSMLAPNTSSSLEFLSETGNGSSGAAPSWVSDIPIANGGTSATTVAGARTNLGIDSGTLTIDANYYANFTAAYTAACSYAGTNNTGAGSAVILLAHSQTYSIPSTISMCSGVTVQGVLPRMEVVSGSMPDLNMILNGGTVFDCAGITTCFTGSNIRGAGILNAAFTNYTNYAISLGGAQIVGAAFSRFSDLYAIGSTTVNGTSGAWNFVNVQDIQADRLFAYNINTGLNLINNNTSGNDYGNLTLNDIYIRAYPKSVANGNSTIPSMLVESLVGELNNVTFNRLHVQDSSVGADGTGTVISVVGTYPYNVVALSMRDSDIEGGDLYGLSVGEYVVFSDFGIVTTAGNTNDIQILENVNNNDFYCSHNCILAALPAAYTFNRFSGLYNAMPSLGDSAMFGVFETYNDTIVHYNAGNVPLAINAWNQNYSIGFQALPTTTTGNNNIAIGPSVMSTSTTAYNNFMGGTYAGLYCTTCHDNLALGASVLSAANPFSGYGNVGIGSAALQSESSYSNTGVGLYAGLALTSGNSNSVYGSNSCSNATTGSNLLCLGAGTAVSAAGDSNEIVIGQGVTGAGSNTAVIGNSSVTDIYLGSSTPNAVLHAKSVVGPVSALSGGSAGAQPYQTAASTTAFVYPATDTSMLTLDGNRTDSYTADGTIERPYQTLTALAAAVPSTGLVSIWSSPNSAYSMSAAATFPAIPTIIYGNNSTWTFSGGVTTNSIPMTIYDLNTVGNVTYSTCSSQQRSERHGGSYSGGNVVLGSGCYSHMYGVNLSGNSNTLTVNGLLYGEALTGSMGIKSGGTSATLALYNPNITKTSGYNIDMTVGGQLLLNGGLLSTVAGTANIYLPTANTVSTLHALSGLITGTGTGVACVSGTTTYVAYGFNLAPITNCTLIAGYQGPTNFLGSITSLATTALTVQSGTTGTVTLDSGTTGAVNIGTNANAKTVTVGNSTSGSKVNIYGEVDGVAASTGYIGQIIQSLVPSGSAVTLTNATPAVVASISLTAGDWNVSASGNFLATSATVAVGNTFELSINSGTGCSSPSQVTTGQEVYLNPPVLTASSANFGSSVSIQQALISTTTTYCLVATGTFNAGTLNADGSIVARRVH